MARVSLVKCQSYNMDEVLKSVDTMFENIGGINKFINPGDKVFLKLNLIMKKHPDAAATTHPAVVEAVSRRIIEAGGRVLIGDSPGGPYNRSILQSIYKGCGIDKVAENTGAELNYDCSTSDYIFSDGVAVKRLTMIKPMMDCDKIITFAKLKTHGMALYTGAVKNMFGAIPGVLKAEYHYRMPDVKDFSNMLVDICVFTKPVLSIIDGVYGMEGDGPTAGTPVHSRVLIASESPYDADVVGAYIMGISPMDVPTIQRSKERKLTSGSIEDIDIAGDKPDDFKKSYKVPDIRTISFTGGMLPRSVEKFLRQMLSPKPVFSQEVCIGCSTCKHSCPPKAITMVDGKPKVDLDKCIRCFCCQELCPYKAVEIRRPWLLRKLLG